MRPPRVQSQPTDHVAHQMATLSAEIGAMETVAQCMDFGRTDLAT